MTAHRRYQAYQLPESNAAAIFSGIAVAAIVLGLVAFNQRSAPRLTPVVYIPQGAVSEVMQAAPPQAERTSSARIDLSFADINNFTDIGIRNTILQ